MDPKIEQKILQLTILQKRKDIILYNAASSFVTPYIYLLWFISGQMVGKGKWTAAVGQLDLSVFQLGLSLGITHTQRVTIIAIR